jgi:hypothetical protein
MKIWQRNERSRCCTADHMRRLQCGKQRRPQTGKDEASLGLGQLVVRVDATYWLNMYLTTGVSSATPHSSRMPLCQHKFFNLPSTYSNDA